MATIAIAPENPRAGLLAPLAPGEWQRLGNWLLVWVVLANAGFAALWFVGAPPRWPDILLMGLVGLVVRERPLWLQAASFCAAMAWSLISFTAKLFNLAVTTLLQSLPFVIEMDPAQSVEYLAGAAVIAILVGLAVMALRRPNGFADARLMLVAALAVLLLAAIDWTVGLGMRGHYNRAAAAGAPFSSAVNESGFGIAAAPTRHLMVVMVESLGQPVGNGEMERLLFARYHQPEVARRFKVSVGTTTYYASTTSGEIRELCGRWGDYSELLDRREDGCLPAQLRRRGYETSAYHSFTGNFFERSDWYPNIGFEHWLFAPELVGAGLRECGGVFPGACDRDVPRVLAARLKDATRPQFLYWLTLNSHLPVPPGRNLDIEHCERISVSLAAQFPMICRQFAIWDGIDAALVREITSPDFPPTDILIVGDHMPPYFDRHSRSQFAPDRVPWLLLRWKGDENEAPAA